ncbi:MAG: hypothetical protein HZB85_05175 [Deltaproteobacteria bacterium]|nr:hypothetical protein [Deltaproteobacteria bacterium]
MTRISIMDRYFISSLIAALTGIIAGLGLVIWFAFAFAWAPWLLLVLAAVSVAWFYRAGSIITVIISGLRPHNISKTHERAGRP